MKEIIFLNGKFIPKEKAKISVFAPGFLYGWGLFETMRAYNNRIIYFDQHLKRIKDSSKLMDIHFPYSLVRLKEIILRTVEINGFRDSYVKLILSKSEKNTDTLVMVKKYKPPSPEKYKSGFRACISQFRQNEDSFFAKMKTTNYILYQLAYLEARKEGFDEAIILNSRGYISEASHSNIFFVKNKKIFTPALACSCLEGITRKVILDLAGRNNLEIEEGNFTLSDLSAADEAFLTNSLIGVMPLIYVEKHRIGKGLRGRLTEYFIKKYQRLLGSF